MTIAVIVAHPDNEVIGAGGTMAKYAKKGEDVYSIILSNGDNSAFLVDDKVLSERRKKESTKSSKIIKNKLIFMNISYSNFREELFNKKAELLKILKKIKPRKIFTHSLEDFNVFHREVNRLVKKLHIDSEIYSFVISNPFRLFTRDKPRVYIDISDTEILKRRALHCFKSQWYLNGLSWYFYPLLILKDKINGFKIKKKYAEVFYKV